MSKKFRFVVGFLFCLIGLIGCAKLFPKAPEDDETLDGPILGLSTEQLKIFLSGDALFSEVFTPEKGLGPLFISNSCKSCHAGDGKGHAFSTLIRFGQTNTLGNQFLNQGGPQLQHRAIPGFQPEQIPAGALFSKFIPPANTGLGFLEAVTDATILALADENDLNNDGISGRPNWITIPSYTKLRVNAIQQNSKYIGRFGKKASVYDLQQQTANAYNQDMGICSNFELVDTYSGQIVDPEVSNQTINDLVFYLQTLKAPIQREQNNPDVFIGKRVFIEIGCGKCHTPQLKTGPSTINVLSNKNIFPYTDLLLHDMGAEFDDGYTEGSANTNEWRTPPLWGLGLSKNAQGGQYFLMHDGRARSIEQAILLHKGEGEQVKNKYQGLTTSDKNKLIKFLESL